MWHWNDSTGGWIVMGIMMIIFWVTIVVLVIYAIRTFTSRQDDRTSEKKLESRADQILDERFARGEISAEEYEQRRRALSQFKESANP